MYLLYADESGSTGTDLDNKQQPIFVLGGLLVKDSDWTRINYIFNEKKKEICPYFENHEIHANEIFNSKKHTYFGEKNWLENFEILEKLVDYITTLDLEFRYVAIDKSSFKKYSKEKYGNHVKIDPYLYSFVHLYENVGNYLREELHESGFIFLDQIIKIDKEVSAIYPIINDSHFFDFVERPFWLNSSDSNFIQIADLYAFYVNKYYCIEKGYTNYIEIKNKHCKTMFEKLSKKTKIHCTLT